VAFGLLLFDDQHFDDSAFGGVGPALHGFEDLEVGFIHSSRAHQVATVANTFYRGDHDLVLLTIDEDLVAAEIRYEEVPGAADPFPHIYGPLDVTAVVRAVPFAPGPDGSFSFAPGPSS
jgi:uncharacterized protein (DUF952 family)